MTHSIYHPTVLDWGMGVNLNSTGEKLPIIDDFPFFLEVIISASVGLLTFIPTQTSKLIVIISFPPQLEKTAALFTLLIVNCMEIY